MISKSRETELLRACKSCNLKKIQDIIKLANSPFVKSKRSNKAASYDDLTNKYSSVSSKNRNVDINCRESKFQMTPLMIASLKGSREIVLFLIQYGANVSLKDVKGNTALQLACMKQRFHVIDALLQNKANPNDVNSIGWNCLISAVNYFHEDSASMLLLLLQTGAKSDHTDNNGLMPIDHAVKKNKINAIRVILNYNTKLAQNSIRALVNASIKGYFDIVLLLLNYGVNPNKVDIITGSGPLHEAVRYNEIKDEKVREERLKIVRFLTFFGADPELVNVKRETPMKLAALKPESIAAQYIEAMKAYYVYPHKTPRYINLNASNLNELLRVPNFALLKPHQNWTRNDLKYCSSFNPNITTNIVTNLIDGNTHTMWTAPGSNLNWVIFDLKADHVITKIRIYCWKSKEMPSQCFLQVSNSIEGPWNCVQSFKCEMLGSQYSSSAGYGVDFNGFNAIARYWRLVITKNHGALNTSFHGIEFFGYDVRISKLLNQLKLNEYEHDLIENGINQLDSLANCTHDIFEALPIENSNDKQKLWNFIKEFQKKVQPLKKLDWFNEPIPFAMIGQNLPAFSVTSTAFLTDTLSLICHGGGIIKGDTMIDMEPGGINDPSMAIFRNISFQNAGKFLIEIRSVKNNEISLSSQPIQIFNNGDPEYERLASKYMALNSKNPKLARLNLNDSDYDDSEVDEAIDQIYGFVNFADRNSQMKIKKWISKTQADDENDDDFNNQFKFHSKHDGLNYYGGSLENHSRNSSAQNSSRYYSPRFNTVSPGFTKEYETQSFTLEFNDDISLTSNHGFEEKAKLKLKQNGPKTEARVYVNNPEIFSPPHLKQLGQVTPLRSSRNHSTPPAQKSITRVNNSEQDANLLNIHENLENHFIQHHQHNKDTHHQKVINSVSISPTISQQENLNNKIINVTGEIYSRKDPIQISPRSFKSTVELSSPRSSTNKQPILVTNREKSHKSQKLHAPLTSHKTSAPLHLSISPTASNPIHAPVPSPPPLSPNFLAQNTSTESVAPFIPPPPPPPLPLLFTPNDSPKPDGLLKFKKISNNANLNADKKPKLDKNMESLQEELERKLVRVRKSLAASENNNNNNERVSALISLDDQNNIHRFDPNLVENHSNNNVEIIQTDEDINSKENQLEDKNNDNFELDPNETFTAKAKKALEKYRSSKSNSPSVSSQANSTNSTLKLKNTKPKHAPLPFRSDNEDPKFVD